MLYAHLDTDKIERIESNIVELGHCVNTLRAELALYLAETNKFQHNPPRDIPSNHRQPTLFEYLGTLSVNARRLNGTLTALRSIIAQGSVDVNNS